MTAQQSSRHYHPYKGERYEEGILRGKRLLIFGHSHYGDSHPGATARVIKEEHLSEWSGFPYFNWIESIALGTRASVDRHSFWQRVAFSNFVQADLGQPGVAPSPDQWKAGAAAFAETIFEFQPDIIMVFSKGAWEWTPREIDAEGSGWLSKTDAIWEYGLRSGKHPLLGKFAHSRNPGEPREFWRQRADLLWSYASKKAGFPLSRE